MLKISDITPASITDEELAAVTAALAVVTAKEPALTPPLKQKVSAWQQAARLENTGRSAVIRSAADLRNKLNPQGILSLIISLLSAASILSNPAFAQQEQQTNPVKLIRVAVVLDAQTIGLTLPDGAVLRDATTGDTIAELPAQSEWKLSAATAGGTTQISFDGQINNASSEQARIARNNNFAPVAFFNGPRPTSNMFNLPSARPQFTLPLTGENRSSSSYAIVPVQEDSAIGINGKFYRGSTELKAHPGSKNNGMTVINHVDVEDYLLSVVPSEMPSGWPLEALKAQAIAARSYVLANLGKNASTGYDVKATVDDQVYLGISSENEMTNRAVHETRGQVLQHEGQVASAYFHSSSGGFTELAENVWSRPVPYLRAVPDYDDESPHFAWTRTSSAMATEQALAKLNKSVGTVLNILPVSRGESPRVRWLLITGSEGSQFLSGEEARRIFSLPSTMFNIAAQNDSYVFNGRGYGHGLGMSQWGAKKLAESGFRANEILSYYYKDVTINSN